MSVARCPFTAHELHSLVACRHQAFVSQGTLQKRAHCQNPVALAEVLHKQLKCHHLHPKLPWCCSWSQHDPHQTLARRQDLGFGQTVCSLSLLPLCRDPACQHPPSSTHQHPYLSPQGEHEQPAQAQKVKFAVLSACALLLLLPLNPSACSAVWL